MQTATFPAIRPRQRHRVRSVVLGALLAPAVLWSGWCVAYLAEPIPTVQVLPASASPVPPADASVAAPPRLVQPDPTPVPQAAVQPALRVAPRKAVTVTEPLAAEPDPTTEAPLPDPTPVVVPPVVDGQEGPPPPDIHDALVAEQQCVAAGGTWVPTNGTLGGVCGGTLGEPTPTEP